jgi:C4-dicarboxylate-specific signal transduction histidine kinase
VVVSVSDDSGGIASEFTHLLFTPNFTTKSSGSGLGLAMVKSSMLGFEGNVRFSSVKNTGTIFYLEFSITDKNTYH